MEDDYPARPQVPGKPPQQFAWIGLMMQYVATDNEVKRPIKRHTGWIALAKGNLSKPARESSVACSRYCFRSSIGANHLTIRAHKLGREKSNVACPAADIQNTHTWRHACGLEKVARRRFQELCLASQPLKFEIGMAEHVG